MADEKPKNCRSNSIHICTRITTMSPMVNNNCDTGLRLANNTNNLNRNVTWRKSTSDISLFGDSNMLNHGQQETPEEMRNELEKILIVNDKARQKSLKAYAKQEARKSYTQAKVEAKIARAHAKIEAKKAQDHAKIEAKKAQDHAKIEAKKIIDLAKIEAKKAQYNAIQPMVGQEQAQTGNCLTIGDKKTKDHIKIEVKKAKEHAKIEAKRIQDHAKIEAKREKDHAKLEAKKTQIHAKIEAETTRCLAKIKAKEYRRASLPEDILIQLAPTAPLEPSVPVATELGRIDVISTTGVQCNVNGNSAPPAYSELYPSL